MLHSVHQMFFAVHVLAGSAALFLFWIPMFAKKGSANHVKFGRYFANGMYAVAISGFIMTILVLVDPIGVREPARDLSVEIANQVATQNRMFATFLFMLSVLVFNSVYHSIEVLKAKTDRQKLKTPFHIGIYVFLLVTGIVVGWIGLTITYPLFMIFAGLSIANSIGTLRYIFKAEIKKREWIIAHMGAILGAGIGAYTAFFVFGGSRLFTMFLNSNGQVFLWVLPGVIGTIASIFLAKKYRKQYRVA